MAQLPPLRDLRRILQGVSLVAAEAAKRSPAIEAARAGNLEGLIKNAVGFAADLAGLTRGTPRQIASPSAPAESSSVVYFSEAPISDTSPPQSQSRSQLESQFVVSNVTEVAAGSMELHATKTENISSLDDLEAGFTKDPNILRENVGRTDSVPSNPPEKENLVNSGGDVLPLKRRRPRERRVPSTPFSRALG